MIRFFGYLTAKSAGGNTFADLSFVYFEALWRTGRKMRALPVPGTSAVDLSPSSRWEPYSAAFVQPVSSSYTNVVVGNAQDLVRLYTIGVKNVAITSSWGAMPTEESELVLKYYDYIICPSHDEAGIYKVLGIDAEYVAPEPQALEAVL